MKTKIQRWNWDLNLFLIDFLTCLWGLLLLKCHTILQLMTVKPRAHTTSDDLFFWSHSAFMTFVSVTLLVGFQLLLVMYDIFSLKGVWVKQAFLIILNDFIVRSLTKKTVSLCWWLLLIKLRVVGSLAKASKISGLDHSFMIDLSTLFFWCWILECKCLDFAFGNWFHLCC